MKPIVQVKSNLS